ncbi:hypothetical protein [Algoriphagus hitonicola]|uniref:Uncharacterized protein n=1 Tax=Algoriphagus hitonicola TaxID=435880 RepID=A0A1I2NNR7_9BACT|nr:hypothetical protein [Algoriphagus hitonicola]SFG03076.1 hypothetical protein SAMN04487988_101121 [Algoriphagus hitonicola]
MKNLFTILMFSGSLLLGFSSEGKTYCTVDENGNNPNFCRAGANPGDAYCFTWGTGTACNGNATIKPNPDDPEIGD